MSTRLRFAHPITHVPSPAYPRALSALVVAAACTAVSACGAAPDAWEPDVERDGGEDGADGRTPALQDAANADTEAADANNADAEADAGSEAGADEDAAADE